MAGPFSGHAESVFAAVGAAEGTDEGDVAGDAEAVAAEQGLGVAVALAMLGEEDGTGAEGAAGGGGSDAVDEEQEQAEEHSTEGGKEQMLVVGEEGVSEDADGDQDNGARQQEEPRS